MRAPGEGISTQHRSKKERNRKYALATAESNCSEAVNRMLVSESSNALEPQSQSAATHQSVNSTEQEKSMVDGKDIAALFREYQQRADLLPNLCHWNQAFKKFLHCQMCKLGVFGEKLLKNLVKHQTEALLNNVPEDAPNFTNDDFRDNAAKLHLLTLAASMDSSKSNVVEGISDLLAKLPLDPITDKDKLGEVDP
ncbi:uncharacterized protein BYT42DRAFT_611715 [Radiomyces spectabilis]|uniref:uncharacterized protein n=1 Tax=Radiomyces spectabilis TaxID=64574 RepID=UPI0022203A8D|nr:uncharacterized protein BYT42DRAFT_611715 [Radiomyces spectabilis]KAI8388704.1 hypothetical protein BYT42DRAFT_611715 [Radiomyces spectabilis]